MKWLVTHLGWGGSIHAGDSRPSRQNYLALVWLLNAVLILVQTLRPDANDGSEDVAQTANPTGILIVATPAPAGGGPRTSQPRAEGAVDPGADTPESQGAQQGPELTYTGEHLILEDPSRDIKRSWLAASGLPGTTPADQDIPNVGPVPEGKWQVDPTKIDEFHWYDPRDWDWWGPWGRSAWGNWRVPIDPVPESPATTRSGFFIHGGSRWGSAGCIDLCRGDESFFQVLRTYQNPIPLTVDY